MKVGATVERRREHGSCLARESDGEQRARRKWDGTSERLKSKNAGGKHGACAVALFTFASGAHARTRRQRAPVHRTQRRIQPFAIFDSILLTTVSKLIDRQDRQLLFCILIFDFC